MLSPCSSFLLGLFREYVQQYFLFFLCINRKFSLYNQEKMYILEKVMKMKISDPGFPEILRLIQINNS